MTYTLRRKTSVKLGNMRWNLGLPSTAISHEEGKLQVLPKELTTVQSEPGYMGSLHDRAMGARDYFSDAASRLMAEGISPYDELRRLVPNFSNLNRSELG